MIARVHRNASMRQPDRLPISSYDEACRHLACLRVDETLADETYFVAVKLVADIYWLTDTRVIRDAAKAARALGVQKCPR